MKVVERKNYYRKNGKTNRSLYCYYQNLLIQAERIGIVSVDFGEITSLTKKISILRDILKKEQKLRC